ncbi:MAG TPA: hypothetical protein VFC46_03595, partial [Humisphaera sp.]|nr:hypothetical protein [Humisphaera sp.]
MQNRTTIARLLMFLCAFTPASFVLAEDAVTPQDMLKLIHVPPGFTVEVVAAPPLIEHPMMVCFDENGRLFVAESAGLNNKADTLLRNPPSSI